MSKFFHDGLNPWLILASLNICIAVAYVFLQVFGMQGLLGLLGSILLISLFIFITRKIMLIRALPMETVQSSSDDASISINDSRSVNAKSSAFENVSKSINEIAERAFVTSNLQNTTSLKPVKTAITTKKTLTGELDEELTGYRVSTRKSAIEAFVMHVEKIKNRSFVTVQVSLSLRNLLIIISAITLILAYLLSWVITNAGVIRSLFRF